MNADERFHVWWEHWLRAFHRLSPGSDPIPTPTPFKLALLGDLRLDVRGELGVSSPEPQNDTFAIGPVSTSLAGTAVGMAQAAAPLFSTVHGLVKLGDDHLTESIRRMLAHIPVTWILRHQSGVANGYVISLRDRSATGTHGRRVMVASSPAPIEELSVEDVEALRTAIETADLFFADGYPLLFSRSRRAVLHAISIARQAGTPVCFDMVPHDIDSRCSPSDLEQVTSSCNLVISSARTIARLLGKPSPYPYGREELSDLLSVLQGIGTAEPNLWILRFGEGDMEEAVLCQGKTARCFYRTGYADCEEIAGFGDKTAAAELAALLEVWSGRQDMFS